MEININGIKNYLESGRQFVVQEGGKLANHSVKLLRQALELAKQDVRFAMITIGVSNIILLESAVLIANLVNKIFIYCWGPEENWKSGKICINHFVIVLLGGGIMGMGNMALYQELKTKISFLVYTASAITVCASYILFRLCMANRNSVNE